MYPLQMAQEVKARRRGQTRISSKNQVTLPVRTLQEAGLSAGDHLMARADGPGRIVLERPLAGLDKFAGALTGAYGDGYLDELRKEWR